MEEKMNESKLNFVQDKWYVILHEGTATIAMYKYQDMANNYVFDHPTGTKVFSKEYLESSTIMESARCTSSRGW